MPLLLFLSFAGGVLTVAAPCILAVLPIILGSNIGHQNKWRPLAMVAGLTLSFTAFGILFTTVTNIFGLSNNTLRLIALSFLALFGLALIFPNVYEKLLFYAQKLWPQSKKTLQQKTQPTKPKGVLNGFIVGISLGLVWVPCAGPILGTILTLAITQTDLLKVTLMLLAYSMGAGLPMLLIAYGGNAIIARLTFVKQRGQLMQRIAGVLLLGGVVIIWTGLDAQLIPALSTVFPQVNTLEENLIRQTASDTSPFAASNTPSISDEAKDQTPSENTSAIPKVIYPPNEEAKAPELDGIQAWINSEPLTLKDLKGKVVLIDFWTYSCINCIRTLPYIKALDEQYKDQGLVIIGVHTPEFAFEKELSNVQKAVQDFGIHYPVVQDNNFGTWNAYKNQYWPAKYLIDKQGYIRYIHFGEGSYDITEEAIRQLLAEGGEKVMPARIQVKGEDVDFEKIETEETYLGYGKAKGRGNAEIIQRDKVQTFTQPQKTEEDLFYMIGSWLIHKEYAQPEEKGAKLTLNYKANKVNLVFTTDKPNEPLKIRLWLDGKPLPSAMYGQDVQEGGILTVTKNALYNLVDTKGKYERHEVTLEFLDTGLKVYAFTFG